MAAPLILPTKESATPIPAYLQEVYWWAYLHPRAVRLFEREWLVNLILWGNFRRLRNAALAELSKDDNQRVLQVACVYGNFTQTLAEQVGACGTVDVVDVAPIQLENLRTKLTQGTKVALHRQDSRALQFADAGFDTTLLFFLLHEQPEDVRRSTLAEALRVTRPGGKVVIVEYHKPRRLNPLGYLMQPLLRKLEPFALDLWRSEISAYLPAWAAAETIRKTTCFGGLYQQIVITRSAAQAGTALTQST